MRDACSRKRKRRQPPPIKASQFFCRTCTLSSQLGAQPFHQTTQNLFVTPVPPPLPPLRYLNQSSFRQDSHVMRYRRLRETHRFFNFAGAKAGKFSLGPRFGRHALVPKRFQNAPPCGIDNGVESAIERGAKVVHRLSGDIGWFFTPQRSRQLTS
jgi:hypothetical protein